MSIRAFVLFLAMAFAVGALSLSALFQPTSLDPLIERVNAPIIAQLEVESADLSEDSDQPDCADCGVDPGPAFKEPCVDCGETPGSGVSVEVYPAHDADGNVAIIRQDDRDAVVVYTPGDAERATQLAQGVYYQVGYLRLLPWEWTDAA